MPSEILSPYIDSPGAVWLRGNLHTHTTRSDGAAAPQTAVDAYAQLGYDFLSLSDHDVAADYSGLDSRGMVLLPNSEVSAGGGHILAIGCAGKIRPVPDRQKVIRAIRAGKGLAILNHPSWEENFNHYPYEEMLRLTGYTGIEIYNGTVRILPGSSLATDKWDRLLSAGRMVWGLASDDSHAPSQVGLGWIVARASGKTPAAILEALRAGSFYASTGVVIEKLEVAGSRLRLVAPEAGIIAVIGTFGAELLRVEGPEMVFDASGYSGPYFRIECLGRSGRMAWTQPFTMGGEVAERRRRLLAARPTLRLTRAARAPELTGRLDDPAWKKASRVPGLVHFKSGGTPPVATEIRCLAAGGSLFIGARCAEPDMAGLKTSIRADGHPSIWADDGIEVFLDVEGAARRYFHITANTLGYVYSTERRAEGGTNRQPRVKCRAARGEKGWSLELAVPLRELGVSGTPTRGTRWGFNVCRNRRVPNGGGSFVWSFTGGSNHQPERFGWLVL